MPPTIAMLTVMGDSIYYFLFFTLSFCFILLHLFQSTTPQLPNSSPQPFLMVLGGRYNGPYGSLMQSCFQVPTWVGRACIWVLLVLWSLEWKLERISYHHMRTRLDTPIIMWWPTCYLPARRLFSYCVRMILITKIWVILKTHLDSLYFQKR